MGRLCAHGKLKCRKCKIHPPAAAVRHAINGLDESVSGSGGRPMFDRAAFAGDCPLFGCQLSAGHPPPHCLLVAGGRYQMVDDHGRILREL